MPLKRGPIRPYGTRSDGRGDHWHHPGDVTSFIITVSMTSFMSHRSWMRRPVRTGFLLLNPAVAPRFPARPSSLGRGPRCQHLTSSRPATPDPPECGRQGAGEGPSSARYVSFLVGPPHAPTVTSTGGVRGRPAPGERALAGERATLLAWPSVVFF